MPKLVILLLIFLFGALCSLWVVTERATHNEPLLLPAIFLAVCIVLLGAVVYKIRKSSNNPL